MDISFVTLMTWIGIVFCISQSAMFSGMNLALFSIGRLRLEVEAAGGNKNAEKLLRLRDDSNFILTTVLWGNVGINVLLTLLSNSVLTGISAFLFSTILITFAGEILPQAYFSRNALKMVSILSPVLRFYQYLLYPFTKSSALFLDWWLGQENIQYFREHNMREIIKKHIASEETDIDLIEGLGALNFLSIDDLTVLQEGAILDSESIVELSTNGTEIVFPDFLGMPSDPFLKKIEFSGHKWVVLTDQQKEPKLVMDADGFLRHALFGDAKPAPKKYCHKPIVVKNTSTKIGHVLQQFKIQEAHNLDEVIKEDIVLIWGEEKRIITGADILGRLMRGIAQTK